MLGKYFLVLKNILIWIFGKICNYLLSILLKLIICIKRLIISYIIEVILGSNIIGAKFSIIEGKFS